MPSPSALQRHVSPRAQADTARRTGPALGLLGRNQGLKWFCPSSACPHCQIQGLNALVKYDAVPHNLRCVFGSEMKEVRSSDIWQVVKCRLTELWLWLFHVMLRWHPVHSIRSSPSAACWLAPIGKYCTPEPVSSSGSPWGSPGVELSHEHVRLAFPLRLARVPGSHLSDPQQCDWEWLKLGRRARPVHAQLHLLSNVKSVPT